MVTSIKAFPFYTNNKTYFLYSRISIEFMQNKYVEIQKKRLLRKIICMFVYNFELESGMELTLAHFIFSSKSSKFLLTGT